jgi:hypothetical protein
MTKAIRAHRPPRALIVSTGSLVCLALIAAPPSVWSGDLHGPEAEALAWYEGAGDSAEAGDYQDRVRIMQDWLRNRRLERENNWARDVVSPRPPAGARSGDDYDEDSGSDYFTRKGLDERGYRRLDGNLRVRIRGLREEPAHVISIDRRGSRTVDQAVESPSPIERTGTRHPGETLRPDLPRKTAKARRMPSASHRSIAANQPTPHGKSRSGRRR